MNSHRPPSREPVRVGLVTNIASPYQVDLFEALAETDVDLTVLFLAETEANRPWDRLRSAGFSFKYVSPNLRTPLGHLNPTVIREMRRVRPDVWVFGCSYFSPSIVLAVLESRRASTPWIYWGERPSRIPVSVVKSWYLRAFLRSAAGIWAISSRARDFYSSVTNGIPVAQVPYALSSTMGSSDLLPLKVKSDPHQEISLLFVGQLISRKNPVLVVRVADVLQQMGHRVKVEFVGSGPLSEDIEASARQLGVSTVTRGNLPRQDVLTRMRRSDVLLLPSRDDGWGMVVMESLAMGTPVVGSRHVDALVEAEARDRVAARAVPVDAEHIAQEVQALIACDEFRTAQLEERARAVVDEFTAHRVAERASRTLRDVLDTKRAADQAADRGDGEPSDVWLNR